MCFNISCYIFGTYEPISNPSRDDIKIMFELFDCFFIKFSRIVQYIAYFKILILCEFQNKFDDAKDSKLRRREGVSNVKKVGKFKIHVNHIIC